MKRQEIQGIPLKIHID